MALSDRDIVITPNRGASTEPIIRFTGADSLSSATITLRVVNSSTISTVSFEGASGQLFSLTDTFAGTIFAVNDVSGIPSIEVLDTGVVKVVEYSGSLQVGGANNNENSTSTATGELRVVGGAGVSRDIYVGGNVTVVGSITAGSITGTTNNATQVTVTDDPSNASVHYPLFVAGTSGGQAVKVDSTGFRWVPSTNRLGIGVGTPSYSLDVAAQTSPLQTVAKFGTGGSDILITHANAIISHNASFNGGWTRTGTGAAGYVDFQGGIFDFRTSVTSAGAGTSITDFSTKFYIANSGLVGVGTQSPASKFHIYESSAADVALTITPTGTTNDAFINMTGQDGNINTEGFQIQYRNNTGDVILKQMWTGITGTTPAIRLSTGNTANALVVAGNGNVGIGTTTPNALLQLGNSSASAELLRLHVAYDTVRNDRGGIRWSDSTNITGRIATEYDGTMVSMVFGSLYNSGYNSNNLMTLRGNGNLGIGTISPGFKLQVVTSAQGTDGIYVYNGTRYAALRPNMGAGTNNGITQAGDTGIIFSNGTIETGAFTLAPWSASTSGLRMTATGDIGIATASPARPLDVNGVANFRSHIAQTIDHSRPNVQWGASGNTTGAVIIYLPGTTANYGMIHAVIDIYTYDGENVSTIIVGGHNWSSAWYNIGATRIGSYSKGIRLGVKNNQYCIVLGTNTSTWSYGQVRVRKIQNGSYYTGIMDLSGSYTIVQDATAESYTWISSNLITTGSSSGGGWNSENDGPGSGLDADFLDGIDSTGFIFNNTQSNGTINLNGGTGNGANDATLYVTATNNNDWGIIVNKNNGSATEYGIDVRVGAAANNALRVLGGGSEVFRVNGAGSVYAPIYYDLNDSNYYADPASTSRLNIIRNTKIHDDGNTFVMRYGQTSGTTRHINLADTTADPSQVVATGAGTGITWGQRTDNNPYYMIHLVRENIGGDYTKLVLSWHTGIRIGASTTYGGTRFFNDAPFTGSEIFSVGKGDSHVRVVNNLYAPIMYDSDNTSFYVDPAGTTVLNQLQVNNISSNNARLGTYTSLTGASTNWFPIFNLADTNTVYVNIRTFAHSSVSFIAARGYGPSQTHSVNILQSQVNANGGYANVTGVRVLENGDVEIQLTWSSGPSVDIGVQIEGTSITPTLVASLVASASGSTVVDSYSLTNGMIRSRGDIVSSSAIRAPIYYDLNDANYYVNPASDSRIRKTNLISSGTAWDDGLNIYSSDATNRWNFLVDNGAADSLRIAYNTSEALNINTSRNVVANVDMRAPIFYDSNDTAYYANPNSISSFYGLAIRGDNSSTDSANQIFLWGSGDSTTSAIGFKANGGEFPNPTGNGDGYNTYLTMDTAGRGWVFRRGTGGTDFNAAYTSGWILNNGIWQANDSMRAPIFYDSNDTNYRLDPAGTSILNAVTVNTINFTGSIGGNAGSADMLNSFDTRNDVTTPQSFSARIRYDFKANTTNGLTDGGTYNGVMFWRRYGSGTDFSGGGTAELAYTDNARLWLRYGTGTTWGAWKRIVFGDNFDNGGIIFTSGDFRAPIFRDSADPTTYYADLNDLTNLKYLKVNTDGSSSGTRALTIKAAGQAEINFGSYSGSWTSALQIQNNDNTDFVWISPLDNSNNARFRTGGSGLDFYTDGANDTGTYSAFIGSGSTRSPIFYDLDNTAYYADFANSELAINVNGSVRTEANGSFVTEGGMLRVTHPGGASFATSTSSVTGAIRIKLPVLAPNTMMTMTIRVYEYISGRSFDVVCGGYHYTGALWTNCFAFITGQPGNDRNFNVRFGNDGATGCIWIGETSTVWSYPQVSVVNFQAGYSGLTYTNWNNGWNISFQTTFNTVSLIISNAQTNRLIDIVYDVNDTAFYVDPASTTRLNNLTITGTFSGTVPVGSVAFNDLAAKTGGSGTYQTSGDFRAPIFYDSNDTGTYFDGSSTGKSLRINGGVAQQNIVGRPYAIWGATSGTGPVVIKFPGGSGNYGMIHAVIDVYEYSGNAAATIIVGGHNWSGSWYNFNAEVFGQTDKPVRVGFKDGKYCIVIGNGSSSWSYGQVVLRKIQNGSYYSGIMDIAEGYTVALESDSYTYISGDLRNLRTPLSFTAGADVRSPIFYDSDNTSYRVDPRSTSILSGLRLDGIDNNASGADAIFWINKPNNNDWAMQVSGNLEYGIDLQMAGSHSYAIRSLAGGSEYSRLGTDLFYHNSNIRAPIFYDTNDTAFYVDPNGTSNINDLAFNGRTAWNTGASTDNGLLSIGYLVAKSGRKLYSDEDFRLGVNSIAIYNNLGGSATTLARTAVSGIPNSSGFSMRYTYNGGSLGTTPGLGGFYFAVGTGANRILICVFKARLLSGYTFEWASNSIGSNGNTYWITSNSGTGRYEEYAYVVQCGNTGTFGSTHFFYVNGSAPAGGTVLFDLASATVYETTDNAVTHNAFVWASGDMRAPIYYSSGNTNFYLEPGVSNAHRLQTPSGYLDLGPMNATFCHFQTDRSRFYFNKTVDVDGEVRIYGDTTNRFGQGFITLRGSSPTIYFRDTDHNSAMLHNNSNLFYVLRGGNDTETWSAVSGWWPVYWNLTNNDLWGGGSANFRTEVTAYASDQRLKENFRTIDSALDKVLKLSGYVFDWNDKAEEVGFTPRTKKDDIGFKAQEVQKILPQAVTLAPFDLEYVKDETGGATPEVKSRTGENYLTVKYELLTPLLVEAIKEQQVLINKLQKDIEELKSVNKFSISDFVKNIIKKILGK